MVSKSRKTPHQTAAEAYRAMWQRPLGQDSLHRMATQIDTVVHLRVARAKNKALFKLCNRRGLSGERESDSAAVALAKHHFRETDGALVRVFHNRRARCDNARSRRRYTSLAHVLWLFHLGKLRRHRCLCVGPGQRTQRATWLPRVIEACKETGRSSYQVRT